jgi:hypothetical protein
MTIVEPEYLQVWEHAAAESLNLDSETPKLDGLPDVHKRPVEFCKETRRYEYL